MKYFFLLVLGVVLLVPSPTYAQSSSLSVIDQYHAILRQAIVILEWRVQELQQGLPNLATAPLGTLTALQGTNRRINPGSGGGGRSTSTPPVVPLVPTVAISGVGNTVTITSNTRLVPRTFTITLEDYSEEVTLPLPSPIHLAAFLTGGGYVDVELVPTGDGTIHEASLTGLLTAGEMFSGKFTILFPEEITGEYIGYTATYQGNSTSSLSIALANAGTAELTLTTSGDNPGPATLVVGRTSETLAVPVLAFGLQATGGGRVTLDQLIIDVQSEPEVPLTAVIGAARLVGAGEIFTATVTDSALVFGDLAFLVERDLFYTFRLEVDLLPQAGNYNFSQTLTFGLEVASVRAFLRGQTDPLEAVAGEAVYSNEQLLVPLSITISADTFFPNFVTLDEFGTEGEFTLEFLVQALFGDFYLKQAATLVSDNPDHGVGFTITGDYGGGSVVGILSSSAEEDTPGVYVVRADETETFTLTVRMTTDTTENFSVTLAEVWSTLNPDGETATDAFILTPAADFSTPDQTVMAAG